jgi:hypothetical protein
LQVVVPFESFWTTWRIYSWLSAYMFWSISPSALSCWIASEQVLMNIWASWSIWSRSVSVIRPYSDMIWLKRGRKRVRGQQEVIT